jgi:hypothetical protein
MPFPLLAVILNSLRPCCSPSAQAPFALFLRRTNHASLGPAVLLCLMFIQVPEGPIQAQRLLIVAPEDTVSGFERPGMVMIDVALRK